MYFFRTLIRTLMEIRNAVESLNRNRDFQELLAKQPKQLRKVKLLDFGLARLLKGSETVATESLAEWHEAAGTLPYMPPEQLRGGPPDFRSDVYAAGTILYEMATGNRPFCEKLPSALIDDIIHKPPPLTDA